MGKQCANYKGRLAEDYVAQYLERGGGKILARNYRSRFGEVDIVAEGHGWLLFVEVKARSKGIAGPLEAVTHQKRQKLICTARQYLAEHPSLSQPRFDVAGVYMQDGRIVKMQYVKNAFMA